ncbi:prolyl oligopeptidase family serine peptidase [Coralloluteibacterium thermophilus]|uniref:Prolyl oligopeptidase family serine peptidase n=1 Tax=Coralloluteibacterium thermophilum TaxID=2707049 RepID=A0ABV9NJ03_9GAMM
MIRTALIATLLLSACAAPPRAARPDAPQGTFVERSVEVAGATHRYRVFVPAAAAPRPVVLFLHGSGERGDDNRAQLEVGLGPHVRAHAATFPAIVVFPQSPAGSSWRGTSAQVALAALEAATAEFGGDRDRTYLTGISRGGYGTWEIALAEPDRFAAVVPVCGGLTPPPARPDLHVAPVAGDADPFAAAAARLRGTPAWLFHGGRDDLVPPEQSRRMAAALEAAGGEVRYTEFPDANHNSWAPAYATPDLWPWLFAQRRRP